MAATPSTLPLPWAIGVCLQMTARTSMTTLIAQVRQLVQDATSPYTLDDDTVQDVLDRHSQRILRHRLDPTYADPSDGLIYWWRSLAGHWEDRSSALLLKDSEGTTLPTSEVDLAGGLWKLTTGTAGPVHLYDGYTYDIYAAAVECGRLLIAKIKDEYTFSSGEGSFSRSDRIRTLETLINQYRGAIRPYMLKVAE